MTEEIILEYKAIKTKAGIFGLLAGIIIWGFFIWGINYALGPTDVLLRVMLLVPTFIGLGVYCFLLLGAFILSYSTTDKALIINWGLTKKKIFWKQVEEIVHIEGKANLFPIISGSWPGYMVGLYFIGAIGSVRMFATKAEEGFLYIKTNQGFYGLTPENAGPLMENISQASNLPVKTINMNDLPIEVKGVHYSEEPFFNILHKLSFGLLIIFGLYLGIMFIRTWVYPFIILLLVLAAALYFFNISNAKRLYYFSPRGGLVMLFISIAITGLLFIITLNELTF